MNISIVAKMHLGNIGKLKTNMENEEVRDQLLSGVWGDERMTLLHIACKFGNVEACRILLDNGAPIDALNANKCTPMHLAAFNGYANVLRLLKERGSRAHIDGMLTVHYDSVLHYAACAKTPKCINVLAEYLAQPGMETPNENGKMPIHCAIHGNLHANVRALANINPECVNLPDRLGVYPIHYAVCSGHKRIFKAILAASTATIDATDSNGFTAMHYAAMHNNYIAMRTLLHNKSRSLGIGHHHTGDRPLHCLARCGHHKTFVSMMWHHAKHVHERNAEGKTVLHLAVEHGHEEICVYLIKILPSLMSEVDAKGLTPLQYAVFSRNPVLVGHFVLGNRELIKTITSV